MNISEGVLQVRACECAAGVTNNNNKNPSERKHSENTKSFN